MLYQKLLQEVQDRVLKDSTIPVMDIIFDVVNFTDKVPDVNQLIQEDSTLLIEDPDTGHNSTIYPESNTIQDIVITNVQERIYSTINKI